MWIGSRQAREVRTHHRTRSSSSQEHSKVHAQEPKLGGGIKTLKGLEQTEVPSARALTKAWGSRYRNSPLLRRTELRPLQRIAGENRSLEPVTKQSIKMPQIPGFVFPHMPHVCCPPYLDFPCQPFPEQASPKEMRSSHEKGPFQQFFLPTSGPLHTLP